MPATAIDGVQRAGSCAVDIVDGAIASASSELKSGGKLLVSGWAAESTNKVPAHFKFILKGTDVYGLDSSTGIARPDVAKVLGSNDALNAGFRFEVPLTGVGAGTYQVFVLTDDNGVQEACDTKHQFVVEN